MLTPNPKIVVRAIDCDSGGSAVRWLLLWEVIIPSIILNKTQTQQQPQPCITPRHTSPFHKPKQPTSHQPIKMQFTVALAAAFAGLAAATCGDNCVRNVGATRFGPEIFAKRLSDCAAFMETTVIPPAVTIVQTVTTATVTVTRAEVVPAYATKCVGDPALYRSACLCNTVAVPTVTAATPTVIVVEEVAATTTVAPLVYQGA
ncbi:hypothetical protein HJFPF1_13232 [Paramyrothecium foliicola]|nr:hypothetical protein HJFPF1_13232 [Paramyrothecium foliicola]